MSNQKERIRELLNNRGVIFQELTHVPAASALEYQKALGTRLSQQVKVLLVRYKGQSGNGYVAVALPAQRQVDLEVLAKQFGAKSVRLATRDELKSETGCCFGELHPFSSIYGKKLLFHGDLLKEEKVYLNAGQLDCSMVVSPQDIVTVEEATLI